MHAVCQRHKRPAVGARGNEEPVAAGAIESTLVVTGTGEEEGQKDREEGQEKDREEDMGG